MIEFEQEEVENLAVIKVIGVGGGGGNAVKRMIEASLKGVEFYVVNTDRQALSACSNATKVQIGADLTNGLGAGSDPELGSRAAEEDKDQLSQIVEDSDMVFITAGMGGGTGTGASPVIAKLAKDRNALTIGVVTKPFIFEGRRRMRQAEEGLEELKEYADSVIVIPNQRLIDEVERNTPIREAFRKADDVLLQGVKSISDLITIPGEINLDFADVKTIMSETGGALMGIGVGQGDNRAKSAADSAVACPLLEEASIDGATGILVNVTGGLDVTLHEVEEAMQIISNAVDESSHVIFGLVFDEDLEDKIQVTVIATGFEEGRPTVKKQGGRITSSAETLDLDTLINRTFPGRGGSGNGLGAPSQTRRRTPPGQSREDFEDFDIPPAQRRRVEPEVTQEIPPEEEEEVQDDTLDIPTFLRLNRNRKKGKGRG